MEITNNPFIRHLEAKKREVEVCQRERFPSLDVPSCWNCSELVTCLLRLSYVDAVHKSMNKDSGGDFEF